MILRKLVNKKEGGEVEATFALTQEQIGVLLNFAIAALIEEGLASVEEVSPDEMQKELHSQILSDLETDQMPQA